MQWDRLDKQMLRNCGTHTVNAKEQLDKSVQLSEQKHTFVTYKC
jgi:hypothetical protein